MIKTVGGNDLSFSCIGQASGFSVKLSVKSIHFGEVQMGNNTNRLLNIINKTTCQLHFNSSLIAR